MADSVEQCVLIPAAQRAENNGRLSENGGGGVSSQESSSSTSASSDCESGVSGSSASAHSSSAAPARFSSFSDQMIRLSAGDKVHDLIGGRFMSGLGRLADRTTVVAIHKNGHSGTMSQARAQAFQVYLHATLKKHGGDANAKYAWCAASTEDIAKILTYGFGHCGSTDNNGLYGSGIYLSPDDHPLESVRHAPIDRKGVRHLLLCRVILGKSELVLPGSEQYHPSSEEFDSGVDSLTCPKKYIVWSTHMNTHILPEYVVSFQAPCCLRGFIEMRSNPTGKPASPWMPFPLLISELSKILPAVTIRSISEHHKDYKVRRVHLPAKHGLQSSFQICG
ncbi:hypothetical protein SAY87_004190 [Trapa incisa]|uniref:Poly [ADP-ribose] polymerase n=1 Tax=Trapa incisa TaxID=236973 RepID=A0AAN7PLS7_9MYRT|nr:hypothetical protein SAY87_004190 [Trapa incisa]